MSLSWICTECWSANAMDSAICGSRACQDYRHAEAMVRELEYRKRGISAALRVGVVLGTR